MHYTNAVLLESFRITSFIPVSVPHCAMENVKVQDYVIPKGAIVLPSLFHVMHDPGYFKNPEIFNPNRSSLFDFSKKSLFIFTQIDIEWYSHCL